MAQLPWHLSLSRLLALLGLESTLEYFLEGHISIVLGLWTNVDSARHR